jgi:hypothetical protein
MALRLYETAAVPTLGQAADEVGLARATLYGTRARRKLDILKIASRLQRHMDTQAATASAIIEQLSTVAASKLGTLLVTGSERIQLDAARDILDRNPATSKTQKIQVDSLSIASHDAKRLADAMIESSRIRALPAGDSVRLPPAPSSND